MIHKVTYFFCPLSHKATLKFLVETVILFFFFSLISNLQLDYSASNGQYFIIIIFNNLWSVLNSKHLNELPNLSFNHRPIVKSSSFHFGYFVLLFQKMQLVVPKSAF